MLLSSDSLLFHGAHERSEDSLKRAIQPNFNSGTSTCLHLFDKILKLFCLCVLDLMDLTEQRLRQRAYYVTRLNVSAVKSIILLNIKCPN